MPTGFYVFCAAILAAILLIGFVVTFNGVTPGGDRISWPWRLLSFVFASAAGVAFYLIPFGGVLS